MLKKHSKNLQDEALKELIRDVSRIWEKYGGREPTPEEWASEMRALKKSLPRSTKEELKARQIERLEEYIDLANSLPPDRYSMDIGRAVREDPNAPPEGTTEYEVKRFKFLLFYLGEPETPPDFREYILEDVTDAVMSFVRAPNSVPEDEVWKPLSGIVSALQRYDEFHETREKLRKIARMKLRRQLFLHNYVPARSHLYADSDGILRLSLDGFTQTVQGLKADRIRECPVCGRIFWANPKSKMACSPRCRNLHNVRRHRELTKKNRAK
jgi:hypothetical protein